MYAHVIKNQASISKAMHVFQSLLRRFRKRGDDYKDIVSVILLVFFRRIGREGNGRGWKGEERRNIMLGGGIC